MFSSSSSSSSSEEEDDDHAQSKRLGRSCRLIVPASSTGDKSHLLPRQLVLQQQQQTTDSNSDLSSSSLSCNDKGDINMYDEDDKQQVGMLESSATLPTPDQPPSADVTHHHLNNSRGFDPPLAAFYHHHHHPPPYQSYFLNPNVWQMIDQDFTGEFGVFSTTNVANPFAAASYTSAAASSCGVNGGLGNYVQFGSGGGDGGGGGDNTISDPFGALITSTCTSVAAENVTTAISSLNVPIATSIPPVHNSSSASEFINYQIPPQTHLMHHNALIHPQQPLAFFPILYNQLQDQQQHQLAQQLHHGNNTKNYILQQSSSSSSSSNSMIEMINIPTQTISASLSPSSSALKPLTSIQSDALSYNSLETDTPPLESLSSSTHALLHPRVTSSSTSTTAAGRRLQSAFGISLDQLDARDQQDMATNISILQSCSSSSSPSSTQENHQNQRHQQNHRNITSPLSSSMLLSQSSLLIHLSDSASQDLLNNYFKYANPLMSFIVQETVFRKNLARGKKPARVLLMAMYALAARYSRHVEIAVYHRNNRGREEVASPSMVEAEGGQGGKVGSSSTIANSVNCCSTNDELKLRNVSSKELKKVNEEGFMHFYLKSILIIINSSLG